MDDRIRELEEALADARHELAHIRFDLEATRREKEASRIGNLDLDKLVSAVGGVENVSAIFVCRRDNVQPYCWLSDRMPGRRLASNQRLVAGYALSNLLYMCGFTMPDSKGQEAGAFIAEITGI